MSQGDHRPTERWQRGKATRSGTWAQKGTGLELGVKSGYHMGAPSFLSVQESRLGGKGSTGRHYGISSLTLIFDLPRKQVVDVAVGWGVQAFSLAPNAILKDRTGAVPNANNPSRLSNPMVEQMKTRPVIRSSPDCSKAKSIWVEIVH